MKDGLGAVQSMLVLGATSDIARATTHLLAGHRVSRIVLAGRHPEVMLEQASDLRARGATQVEVLKFDAADTSSHQAVIDEAWSMLGDIDVVLVAFGVLSRIADYEAEPADGARAVIVNHAGAVSACLASASRLRRQGHGLLCVLSSVAGVRVRKSNYVYGGSKAGLDGFAQGLGDALAGSGASVMIVRPGFVRDTKMTAGMRTMPMSTTAEAVAAAIAHGIERERDVVWCPPAMRFVATAMKLVPRPLWRRLPL